MEGDEVYDVITEDGSVLYQATWTECHTKGLLHQVVCLLLWKDESRKELFLQKRSTAMKQMPGRWQHSVGGHVRTGETLEEALESEIKEELFYNTELPDLQISKIGQFLNHDFEANNEILHLYEGFSQGPFSHDPNEVGEGIFRSFDEICIEIEENPENFTPSFIGIVEFYHSKEGLRISEL